MTSRRPPSDEELRTVLGQVRLAPLLQRCGPAASASSSNGDGSAAVGLDCRADWAAMLSLGEQQRLAFARCGGHWRQHLCLQLLSTLQCSDCTGDVVLR